MICKQSLFCILDPGDYLCDLNHSIRTKFFHSVVVLDCRKHSQLPWSSSLHMRWLSQSPSFWKRVSRGWSPALRGSSLLADSFLKIRQNESMVYVSRRATYSCLHASKSFVLWNFLFYYNNFWDLKTSFHKVLTITSILILWWWMNTCSEKNRCSNLSR